PDGERYEELIDAHAPLPRVDRSGDDLLLWYTGGTTGTPKGVLWHQGTLTNLGLIGAYALQDQPVPASIAELIDDVRTFRAQSSSPVVLVTTPLVHAAAVHQANTAFLTGGTIVLLERGPVDGDDVCTTIFRERVTMLQTVGSLVMRRIVDALTAAERRDNPYDLSSVRQVRNSGAMISAPLKDALLTRGTMHIYDALGASEATGFALSVASKPGDSETAHFALGPSARVLAEGDRDVVPGSGERGVLAVRNSIAIGYYKDPERTATTFRTIGGVPHAIPGDWALHHADGSLTLLGRGSGCINTGGEKVWPEEVEEALKEHPHVADAAVVGVPDGKWGEIIGAVIARAADAPELTPGSLDTTSLDTWLADRIAGYKRPRRYIVVDEVRRTSVDKVDYEWARATLSERLTS
ncbi:MAG TPA: AMP-binding protein, partial [Acidimicrobiia bacterium]